MGIRITDIMSPSKSACVFNSDYADLGIVAGEYNKNVHYFAHIDREVDYVKKCRPDIIFVLGFSQIIPKSILDIPTIGTIGSHPALLPCNRGRHPIIWALAKGLKKGGLTLFWLDQGVDTGDIWAQKEFKISFDDDASAVYKKAIDSTVDILKQKVPELEKGTISRTPQDHSKANYWRKRTEKDGEVDWRMSSEEIYNLVRALAGPYVGAHCNTVGKNIKIWKTRILQERPELKSLRPGKIINIEGRRIIIKTGNGLIELLDHEFELMPEIGDYL
ncbi:MAG: methionyl-tRNA formyltransferase [Candidatus Omnitrophica bacterium]|nr:methionyl-tRNA formyltransferase [Candidatus Omnitrophota bacterium]